MLVVNTSVQYPTIQSWDEKWEFFDCLAVWPEDLDTTEFYAYNGFVILSIEEIDGVKTVVSYTPDVEAWEEWKKNNPDEPFEPVEDVTWDAMAAAITEGVNDV